MARGSGRVGGQEREATVHVVVDVANGVVAVREAVHYVSDERYCILTLRPLRFPVLEC